jgi:hypothetical protein
MVCLLTKPVYIVCLLTKPENRTMQLYVTFIYNLHIFRTSYIVTLYIVYTVSFVHNGFWQKRLKRGEYIYIYIYIYIC